MIDRNSGIDETVYQMAKIIARYDDRPNRCEDCDVLVVSGKYEKSKTARRHGREKGDHHISNLIPYDYDGTGKVYWLCAGCYAKRKVPILNQGRFKR